MNRSTSRCLRYVSALALAGASASTHATVVKPDRMIGGQTLVNTTTTNNQMRPSVAVDADGDYAIAWQGQGVGDLSGVFVRRYSPFAAKDALERRVNTITEGTQTRPDIATDAVGNTVVVWSGNGPGDASGVFFRRMNAAGQFLDATERRVNEITAGYQQNAAVAMDNDGEFVIVWETYTDNTHRRVHVRRFLRDGSAGEPTEVAVSPNALAFDPDVALQPAPKQGAIGGLGEFVVVWEEGGVTTPSRVFARRYNGYNGQPLSAPLNPNDFLDYRNANPAVAMRADGTAVVVWEFDIFSSGNTEIHMRKLPGTTFSGQSTELQTYRYAATDARNPAVTVGRYTTVTTWQGTGSSGIDTFALLESADRNSNDKESNTFQVNLGDAAGTQSLPAVGADADGDFVIAYSGMGTIDTGFLGVYHAQYRTYDNRPLSLWTPWRNGVGEVRIGGETTLKVEVTNYIPPASDTRIPAIDAAIGQVRSGALTLTPRVPVTFVRNLSYADWTCTGTGTFKCMPNRMFKPGETVPLEVVIRVPVGTPTGNSFVVDTELQPEYWDWNLDDNKNSWTSPVVYQ